MERMSTPSSQKKTRLVVESYDHSHGIDSIIDSSVVDDDNDSDEDDNESRCLLVLDNAALLFGDTIVVTSLEEFVVVDVALLLVFVAFSLFFFFNLMEGDNGCVPCTGDVGWWCCCSLEDTFGIVALLLLPILRDSTGVDGPVVMSCKSKVRRDDVTFSPGM